MESGEKIAFVGQSYIRLCFESVGLGADRAGVVCGRGKGEEGVLNDSFIYSGIFLPPVPCTTQGTGGGGGGTLGSGSCLLP